MKCEDIREEPAKVAAPTTDAAGRNPRSWPNWKRASPPNSALAARPNRNLVDDEEGAALLGVRPRVRPLDSSSASDLLCAVQVVSPSDKGDTEKPGSSPIEVLVFQADWAAPSG